MTPGISDRKCLVTGAARGIGRAAVEILLSRGAWVMAADRDEHELAAIGSALKHDRLTLRACDVSDREAVGGLLDHYGRVHGRLDVLVNNAAIADDTGLADLTHDRLAEVMAVNFEGALNCIATALPMLRGSRAASVINIASTQGFRGQPNAVAYSASKGALISLTRSLAVDLGPQGIRVNALAPGFIDTRMAIQRGGTHEHESEWFRDVYIRHGRLPLRRPGKPDDVAGPIAFLASDDSRYVTGQVIVVDGGLTCTY